MDYDITKFVHNISLPAMFSWFFSLDSLTFLVYKQMDKKRQFLSISDEELHVLELTAVFKKRCKYLTYNYLASKKYRRGEADATSIVSATKSFNLTGCIRLFTWESMECFSLALGWTWKIKKLLIFYTFTLMCKKAKEMVIIQFIYSDSYHGDNKLKRWDTSHNVRP